MLCRILPKLRALLPIIAVGALGAGPSVSASLIASRARLAATARAELSRKSADSTQKTPTRSSKPGAPSDSLASFELPKAAKPSGPETRETGVPTHFVLSIGFERHPQTVESPDPDRPVSSTHRAAYLAQAPPVA